MIEHRSVNALGRSWMLLNESTRPTDEIESLLVFALDQTRGLSARGSVKVADAGARTDGHYAGRAGDRLQHSLPKWTGRARYMMRLTIPTDEWERYGEPQVCWHSSVARDLARADGIEAVYRYVRDLHDSSGERWGRWPIYIMHNWRELFVHLAAHEAAHLLQYDRDRGHSEVFCEEFAARALDTYRKESHA